MNASGQSKSARPVVASGVKKGQKLFSIGTPVEFNVWEGSIINRKGVVVLDGRPWVVVDVRPFGHICVLRAALRVRKEAGK